MWRVMEFNIPKAELTENELQIINSRNLFLNSVIILTANKHK